MCARFETAYSLLELAKRYSLSVIPKHHGVHKTEKRPTDDNLVITAPHTCEELTWGFQMSWSPKPLINARSETLFEKSTYQNTRDNRCLIPASAWFEWRKDQGKKHKNRIALHDTFTMAAIRDGNRFCILTCAPSNDIAHIHNRMPVLVPDDLHAYWLDASIPSQDLKPYLKTPQNITFNVEEEIKQDPQMSLF